MDFARNANEGKADINFGERVLGVSFYEEVIWIQHTKTRLRCGLREREWLSDSSDPFTQSQSSHRANAHFFTPTPTSPRHPVSSPQAVGLPEGTGQATAPGGVPEVSLSPPAPQYTPRP